MVSAKQLQLPVLPLLTYLGMCNQLVAKAKGGRRAEEGFNTVGQVAQTFNSNCSSFLKVSCVGIAWYALPINPL